jgi:hypothetical protein
MAFASFYIIAGFALGGSELDTIVLVSQFRLLIPGEPAGSMIEQESQALIVLIVGTGLSERQPYQRSTIQGRSHRVGGSVGVSRGSAAH